MTVCVCIVAVKLPRVLFRRAGRSRRRSPCDRPTARQHPREFDTNNTHTQSCLILIITWCHHLSTATNFLLMKSNLKFESRATAVSVAMSPRYRGGNYRSRLHPRSRKWACHILRETLKWEIELRQTGVICYPWRQRSWSCGVFTSRISDAHCAFQWIWQVLHNYDISVLQHVGMFFDRIACLMKVWPLFKREFPRVPMTWRSARARANFKCDVADVNK